MSRYEMTSPPHYYPIVEQPQAIDNVFSLGPGEKVLQTYECDERCCGCGDKYRVTLTDARIIQRRKNKTCCCSCERADSMLFLSDVSSLQNRIDCRCCPESCDLLSILICCLCGVCLICCTCCCNRGIPVAIRGPFGQQIFTFDRKYWTQAMADIPIAATPHKTSRHNYVNQSLPSAPVATIAHKTPKKNHYNNQESAF